MVIAIDAYTRLGASASVQINSERQAAQAPSKPRAEEPRERPAPQPDPRPLSGARLATLRSDLAARLNELSAQPQDTDSESVQRNPYRPEPKRDPLDAVVAANAQSNMEDIRALNPVRLTINPYAVTVPFGGGTSMLL